MRAEHKLNKLDPQSKLDPRSLNNSAGAPAFELYRLARVSPARLKEALHIIKGSVYLKNRKKKFILNSPP